jgi:hypothetical protein
MMNKTGIISLIKKLCEPATLTRIGKQYLGSLESSFDDHGEEGLKRQVLYVIANGKWPKKFKENRKSLESYGKTGDF